MASMLKFTIDKSSSLFLRELVKRQLDMAARPRVGYTLVCPDDLRWWYWLEFGTAGRQDASAPYKSAHSGTYPIDPHMPPMALAWNEGGTTRFAVHVDHPGIRPRLIYRGVRDQILDNAYNTIAEALDDEISVSSMETALRDIVMPNARQLMGTALEMAAPGVKQHNPYTSGTSKSTGQNAGKVISGTGAGSSATSKVNNKPA